MFGFGKINPQKYVPKIVDRKQAYRRGTHSITFETVNDKNFVTFIIYAEGEKGGHLLIIYEKDYERCHVKYNSGDYGIDYGHIRTGKLGDKLSITWSLPDKITLGDWNVEMRTILKDGSFMEVTDKFTIWVEDEKEKEIRSEEYQERLKEYNKYMDIKN